jgi:hypothetical protein
LPCGPLSVRFLFFFLSSGVHLWFCLCNCRMR